MKYLLNYISFGVVFLLIESLTFFNVKLQPLLSFTVNDLCVLLEMLIIQCNISISFTFNFTSKSQI